MLTANQIADYIVNLSNYTIEDDVTNLKLQKLLYYVQGHYSAITGELLFEDAIQAWQHGPVIPKVYNMYKIYGYNVIVTPKQNASFSFIDNTTKVLIHKITNYYKQFSASKLRQMTHEERPWKETYKIGLPNLIISNELIRSFFKQSTLNKNFEIKTVKEERELAAQLLLDDYLYDEELTAFKSIEGDDFYEM